jgi:cytochrome b
VNPSVSVRVWDLPTRVFHWLLALSVLAAYVTGGERGTFFVIHVGAGHLILLLLLFRLFWGFIGSPHSRFADFVFSWRSIGSYVKDLARFRHRHFVGHNPLGGLMVLAMLMLLLATVGTGLSGAAARGYQAGSLLIAAMGRGSRALGELHETLGNLVIILAGIHVAAVFGHWLLARENLVRAMITGRKRIPPGTRVEERPLAGPARTGAVLALVSVAALVIFSRFDATTLMTRPDKPASVAGDSAGSSTAPDHGEEPAETAD